MSEAGAAAPAVTDEAIGGEARPLAALYYDGTQSRPRAVTLRVEAGQIVLCGDDIERRFGIEETRVSERLQNAPRLLTLADGTYCEVADNTQLDALLAATGHRDSWVVRWQNSWRYALGALVTTVGVIAFGYLVGLPWAAEQAAARVPPALEARIGADAVRLVDRHLFSASELSESRREELRQRFAAIAPRDSRAYRLEFRKSRIGPNALALPGGIIVMTDELAELAPNDDAIIGVLVHELGHIERRHFLRRVISSTVTGAVATLIAGDASGVLTALPATLADLSYSRDMEREADSFAIELLRAHGISPAPLAEMLERLEDEHAERRESRKAETERGSGWSDYLSTHPHTAERAHRIRDAARK